MHTNKKPLIIEIKDFLISKITFTKVILILFALICIAFLTIAFWAPHIAASYNEYSSVFYQAPANISATLYNSMSPFIAIVAALLTFMAFWVQHKANEKMLENHERQEVERQFYEMLRIHKENVGELKWDRWSIVESSNPQYVCEDETIGKGKFFYKNKYAFKSVEGREVFGYLYAEFYYVLVVVKKSIELVSEYEKLNFDINDIKDYKIMLSFAYKIFFEGKGTLKGYFDEDASSFFEACDNELEKVRNFFEEEGFSSFDQFRVKKCLFDDFSGFIYLHCYYFLSLIKTNNRAFSFKTSFSQDFSGSDLFKGHIFGLNHYYRHLFQMVKIIANYKESIVKKEEKRKYLRMLRAQLTNFEQLMLFYNWLSGYGYDWENEKNHFFTTFRMIHNIVIDDQIIFKKFGYEKIVKMIKDENPNYRDYEDDYLFEFEESKIKEMVSVYDRIRNEKNAFTYDDLLPSEIEDVIGRKRFFDVNNYVVTTYYKIIYVGRMEKCDYEKAITDIQNFIKQMFIWED